jgi:AGZA family xanthine/uracil permease-like MFS transporter
MRIIRDQIYSYFNISGLESTIPREIQAGITTFLTMSYILFVNPDMLGKAIPLVSNGFGQLMTATALSAAIACILMGIVARFPFALAPGMGLNAFFTFSVVLGDGIPWQTALGCIFISGIIFVVVSVTGIRESILSAIPATLKRATAAGIGFFLATIGLENSGLVVSHPATLVQLGDVRSAGALLTFAGILLTGTLMILKVRGAILFGIVIISIAAIALGAPVFQGKIFAGLNSGVFQLPVAPTELFISLDVVSAFSTSMIAIIIAFFFVDFFDTAGTLIGLSDKAGFTDKNGNLPRGSKAFLIDGAATSIGSVIGTTSVTTYIESMSGIEQGGRTGLTAVVTGIMFLLSLFLWPLATAVPSVATAPALIIVGAAMMTSVAKIEWDDFREAIPGFITILLMPLSYSIANGISIGVISWTLLQVLTGNSKKIHSIMYILTALLTLKYFFI